MARTYKVDVLMEDFEHGTPRDSNRCAVKRAVARDIPGAKRVEVDLQTVRFSLNDERFVFLTPWQVSEYVIAYDAADEEHLQPFSFQLRPSQEVGSKVRRKVFTEEGKKIDNARNRVRKAEAKKDRALHARAQFEPETVEAAKAREVLETIDDEIAKSKLQLKEIRAEVKATRKPQVQRVDSDLPKAPRKSKMRTRHFGMRELRVNQGEGRSHTPSGRPPAEYEPVE